VNSGLDFIESFKFHIALFFSGLVELACLFFPKVYIVLMKPEKNTKEVVMAPNRSSFAALNNSSSQQGNASNTQPNGGCKKHLNPDDILISSNGSFSDTSC